MGKGYAWTRADNLISQLPVAYWLNFAPKQQRLGEILAKTFGSVRIHAYPFPSLYGTATRRESNDIHYAFELNIIRVTQVCLSTHGVYMYSVVNVDG